MDETVDTNNIVIDSSVSSLLRGGGVWGGDYLPYCGLERIEVVFPFVVVKDPKKIVPI